MWILWLIISIQAVTAQLQCSQGLTALLQNNQAVSCNPQVSTSCSSIRQGFSCQMATSGTTFICCGTQQCSSGSPQIGSNGQAQTCQFDSNCQSGFACQSGMCCPQMNSGATIQIGGACTFGTTQCAAGSTCQNGQCQCPQGTSQSNGQCIQGQSICAQGMVNVNGMGCLQQSSLNGQCQGTPQCPLNSQCLNAICSCNPGFQVTNNQCASGGQSGCPNGQVMANGQCMNQSPLGGQCSVQQQCPTNAQCSNSLCSCMNGFQNSNGQCIGGNNNNNCPSGQVNVNGICMQQTFLGGQCSGTPQCPLNAQCLNQICACNSGFQVVNNQCSSSGGQSGCSTGQVNVNGQCLNQSPLGGGCSFQQQCPTNAQCSNGFCSCMNGFQTSNGQCIGGNNNNSCQPGQVFVNGQCLNIVPIGGQCQFTQQCQQGTCQNGICISGGGGSQQLSSCPNGQVLINNECFLNVQIGSSCTFSQQCLGNSQCNGTCQCQNGMTNVGGQCSNNGNQSPPQYNCIKSGYNAPLINNQPVNCMTNRCPDQYNSVCEFNQQAQFYICCTKNTAGKR